MIQAIDGSRVQLDAATIVGGTLSTTNLGVIETVSWGLLRDLTLAGQFRVFNYDDLYLEGAINNTGTIEINATTGLTDLRIEDVVTLSGGGSVLLGGANARILDETGDALGHLVNVDNTIHGQGRIGIDRTQITNQSGGTIDADVSGVALHVDPNASGFLNQGTLQASGGGVLSLEDGTFTNTGATIQALDASVIQLDNATIIGGTLATSGSGYVETATSGVLRDLNIAGEVRVHNNHNLTLEGTINNTGTIEADASTYYSDLVLEGVVTLTGGGEIVLGHGHSRILDESGEVEGRLINQDNTISGLGQIGAGRLLEVVSNGAIVGDSSTDMLTVSVPLSGTGSLENVTIESTYAPGASPAAIAMDGLVEFVNTSTLEIEIGGPSPGSQHDRLDSAGDVSLDGALQIEQIDLGGGLFQPQAGDAFVIITATGELTGQFGSVVAANLDPTVVYDVFYDYDADLVSLNAYYAGDFDHDGDVDVADLMLWQRGGSPSPCSAGDLDAWRATFGMPLPTLATEAGQPVPEPGTLLLCGIGGLILLHPRRVGFSQRA